MKISDKDRNTIQDLMDTCCSRLMEAGCDSVQIVSTAHLEGNNWCHFSRGDGNLFARYGATREWIEQQSGMTVANEIAGAIDSKG